jgi:hypothetical protein
MFAPLVSPTSNGPQRKEKIMIAVPGLYEDGKITLLEPIPHLRRARVIVTVLEDNAFIAPSNVNDEPTRSWLGAFRHTLVGELGDLVEPLEDAWQDWEVLRE